MNTIDIIKIASAPTPAEDATEDSHTEHQREDALQLCTHARMRSQVCILLLQSWRPQRQHSSQRQPPMKTNVRHYETSVRVFPSLLSTRVLENSGAVAPLPGAWMIQSHPAGSAARSAFASAEKHNVTQWRPARICKFTAHARPKHIMQQPRNGAPSTCQKHMCECLLSSQLMSGHSMHLTQRASSHVFNPCVPVQLQQQPGLETIPADSPTDIESNSSLSEDGADSLPGEAYVQPAAPR